MSRFRLWLPRVACADWLECDFDGEYSGREVEISWLGLRVVLAIGRWAS